MGGAGGGRATALLEKPGKPQGVRFLAPKQQMVRRRQPVVNYVNYIAEKLTIQSPISQCVPTIRHGHRGAVESLRGAGVPRMLPCTSCQLTMNHEPP